MEYSYERSVGLMIAEEKIDSYFKENDIEVELTRYGSPLSSTVATLKFSQQEEDMPCIGCGKGYEQEARVGAKYEAYEHHQGLIRLRQHATLTPFHEVIKQEAIKNFIPLQLLTEHSPDYISAVPFHSENLYPLLWPTFLNDYNYVKNRLAGDNANYDKARRYSCGTGFAAGVGYTEAAIHAISEVIERHCVGTYLARVFFYQQKYVLARVAVETMPEMLRNILKDAEKSLGNDIQVFDISIDGLPAVYIAYCKSRPISGIHIFGSGCSIYPSHAAARAIKELVQQHAVESGVEFVRNEWKRHYRHLEKYPKLLHCLIADITDKPSMNRTLRADPEKLSLKRHLLLLTELCNQHNLPVWHKQIDYNPTGVSIACAVMPAMERFSIVSHGNYVIPTASYKDE